MQWVAVVATLVAAEAIEPITYAELLTFQEDAVFEWENFSSWQSPHGGSVYCAAPVTLPGNASARRDVYAVGYDCCADGQFECFRDVHVYVADPGQALDEAERDTRYGLIVDYRERESFQRAAEKSPVYWAGGRQRWSPKPLMVYVVPSQMNHCSTKELSVCGDGRNVDSCPPPVAQAFDLSCPGIEQCMRNWDSAMEMYHHVCIPRPFRERFRPDDRKEPPEWWEGFKGENLDHPITPGAPLERGNYPPVSRDGVYNRDATGNGKWNDPGDTKWEDPGGDMWRHRSAEAPEWSSPGASKKWRRPSGEMWDKSTSLLRGTAKRTPQGHTPPASQGHPTLHTTIASAIRTA